MKTIKNIMLLFSALFLIASAGCKERNYEGPLFGSCTFETKKIGSDYDNYRMCVEGKRDITFVTEDLCNSINGTLYEDTSCKDNLEICGGCPENYNKFKESIPKIFEKYKDDVYFRLCGHYCAEIPLE